MDWYSWIDKNRLWLAEATLKPRVSNFSDNRRDGLTLVREVAFRREASIAVWKGTEEAGCVNGKARG
jgi:hypothetical protein